MLITDVVCVLYQSFQHHCSRKKIEHPNNLQARYAMATVTHEPPPYDESIIDLENPSNDPWIKKIMTKQGDPYIMK